MSYSRILIHGQALCLKANYAAGDCRKQNSNVVCCCPWSGSDMKKKKIVQKNRYESTTSLEKLNRENNGNSPPFSDLPTKANQFVINFITFLLSFGPLKGSRWEKLVESADHRRRLPPGPSMLHLMGYWHYFIRSVPYHYLLRDLQNTYGPLMHIKVGERSVIVASSANMAKEVLKTHDVACADRPKTFATQIISYNYNDIVTSPYGEYWRQMRSICIKELLGAKNVRSFEHIRQDEASALVESILSTCGAPCNLTEKVFWFMNSVTFRAVFGEVPGDRGTNLIMLIREGMRLGGRVVLADFFPSIKAFNFTGWNTHKLLKMRPEMDKIVDTIIDEHIEKLTASTGKGSEDLVDVLLRLKESGQLELPITNDNMKAVIGNMFAGGTESSSATVDWAMAELMKNPQVMAKAQDEIRQALDGRQTIEESEIRKLEYLEMVVKETLRLHPAGPIIPRACREEFEVDGYRIPLNANVIVNVWAIGRDPNYWRNPESFEPERFELENPIDFMGSHFEYVPFGSGKRICPGLGFGIANVKCALAHLLYHFDWELPPGITPHHLDMSENMGVSGSRMNALHLIATPYNNLF